MPLTFSWAEWERKAPNVPTVEKDNRSMPTDELNGAIAPRLRYVKVAAAVMILAVCCLALVMFQISNWKFLSTPPKMLTIIGGFASLMLFSMSFAIPKIFGGSSISGLTDQAVRDSTLEVFIIETFIQLALLLGAAFMNLIVYSVDHHIASLVVAAIAVILMLIRFPRTARANSVIRKKLGSRE